LALNISDSDCSVVLLESPLALDIFRQRLFCSSLGNAPLAKPTDSSGQISFWQNLPIVRQISFGKSTYSSDLLHYICFCFPLLPGQISFGISFSYRSPSWHISFGTRLGTSPLALNLSVSYLLSGQISFGGYCYFIRDPLALALKCADLTPAVQRLFFSLITSSQNTACYKKGL